MATIKEYKEYWLEEASKEKIKREKLRKEAHKTALKLQRILINEFGVKKVVLFGSILKKGFFNEDSDIDIAVEGLSKKDYFSALARLMMESTFEVDLKPIEDSSDLLKQRIAKGKVLYEKFESA